MLFVEVFHDGALKAATDVLSEFTELPVMFTLPPFERAEGGNGILDTQ